MSDVSDGGSDVAEGSDSGAPVVDLPQQAFSASNMEKIRTLEVLEEALTIFKGISEQRMAWKESRAFNDKMMHRTYNDDIQANLRRKMLLANDDMQRKLLLDTKFSAIRKAVELDAERRTAMYRNTPKFVSTLFCPYGRALLFDAVDGVTLGVFSDGLLVAFDRSKENGAPLEPKDVVVLSAGDLSCACLSRCTLAPGDHTAALDLFLVAADGQASLLAVDLVHTDRPSRKHVVRVDVRETSATPLFDQTDLVPGIAVPTPGGGGGGGVFVCQDSTVFQVGFGPLAVKARIDLRATLRLPPTPAGQQCITGVVERASSLFVATRSGCLVQVQVAVATGALRATLVHQYGALETRVATSQRFQDLSGVVDDDDDDNANDNGNSDVPVKFSYAPTSIASVALSPPDAILSACEDGTVRLQNVGTLHGGESGLLIATGDYAEQGFLSSCVAVAATDKEAITADASGRLALWSLKTRRMVGSYVMEGVRGIHRIALSRADDRIVVVFAENVISQWSYAHCTIDGVDDDDDEQDEPAASAVIDGPTRRSTDKMRA